MKAVYIERYGGSDVLQYGEQPRPEPARGQLLIEVHAAALNPRDWLIREGKYPGRWMLPAFPLMLGSDAAGTVIERGPEAKHFSVGDAVLGLRPLTSPLGCYAEYVVIDEASVTRKPESLTFVDAAAMPTAALTAYQALRDIGGVGEGSRVCVNGASGGVGSYAVQLAKALGAAQVTGICSGRNAELVRSLGADRVIDYERERFADVLEAQDCFFDAVGRSSLQATQAVLTRRGRYITTVPSPQQFANVLGSRARGLLLGGSGPSAHVVVVRASGRDLSEIVDLAAAGRVRSVIDEVFDLSEAAAAHEKSRTWRARGKLVLGVKQ